MVLLPPFNPINLLIMYRIFIYFFFINAAWESDSFQDQAWLNPQPLVSSSSWPNNISFRALDVQGQSALIKVQIKAPSENCEVLEDCFPVYRVEHWHLPDLRREGLTKTPIILGELIAARIASSECFFFYRDRLVITDRALNLLESVPYPEFLQERLDRRGGTPIVGISGNGDFVFIDTSLWDRQRRYWHTEQKWELISPGIAMGHSKVMALGSYHSGAVWLIPYRVPNQSHRLRARTYQRLFLSPDEQRLLIQQRRGLHRLINVVEKPAEIQRWRQRIHYQRISWKHNRSLAIKRNGGWTLYQIEPYQIIARGSQAEESGAIVSEQMPIGIFLNPEQNTANLIHLDDGRSMGQQKLPGLSTSYSWLGQGLQLAYSQRPLTLLLYSGLSNHGIQQFRPYRLEMRERQ